MNNMKTLEEVNYYCPICGRDLADDPEDWMEEKGACVECVAEGLTQ